MEGGGGGGLTAMEGGQIELKNILRTYSGRPWAKCSVSTINRRREAARRERGKKKKGYFLSGFIFNDLKSLSQSKM